MFIYGFMFKKSWSILVKISPTGGTSLLKLDVHTKELRNLPVYFGSGGGRGDHRIPISGVFAHAIVKKLICIMYMYLHVFLPFFFFFFFLLFFLLITPIICKYCNLSRNFCTLPLYFTYKDCIMLWFFNLKKKKKKKKKKPVLIGSVLLTLVCSQLVLMSGWLENRLTSFKKRSISVNLHSTFRSIFLINTCHSA